MMVETFMAQSFCVKHQTSNVKHQTLNIKDKENMSDNKKLYKTFLFLLKIYGFCFIINKCIHVLYICNMESLIF